MGAAGKILLYDSHIDTVDVGDKSAWGWDPFQGKVENGVLYARGAGDEKQSTPGMLNGLALAKELGLLDGFTAYYSETWRRIATAGLRHWLNARASRRTMSLSANQRRWTSTGATRGAWN